MTAPPSSDEMRSEETPMRRGSPLPWLLLFFVVVVGLGIFLLAQRRLADEKQHTANALKADDEIHSRLKGEVSDRLAAQQKQQEAENKVKELEMKLKDLEDKTQTMSDELDKLKKKGSKK
jgi:uncharacterized protein HemX